LGYKGRQTYSEVNMNRFCLTSWLAVAAALCLAACGSDSGSDNVQVSSGTYYHYVTNSVKAGANPGEAAMYGFDLDNDPNHRIDNALGTTLTLATALGLNIDDAIAGALTAGDFVILHSVRADSLTADPSVSWTVIVGDPKANPTLTGGGSFTITGPPVSGTLNGGIAVSNDPAGATPTFLGGPGTITLALSVLSGTPPVSVKLISGRIQAQCTSTGCTHGKIGGAVLVSDLHDKILPAIAMALNTKVHNDGCGPTPPPPTCTSGDQTLLSFFDTNPKDGTISVSEFVDNPTIKSFQMPDMDLLDASGNPGHDGVAESISLGLGFSTASASFMFSGDQ
jgi:hypothetical protein